MTVLRFASPARGVLDACGEEVGRHAVPPETVAGRHWAGRQRQATAALQRSSRRSAWKPTSKRLQRESDGKQEMLVYEGHKPGELLISALQPVIEATIAALPIPKMMSYQLADGETTIGSCVLRID